MNIKKKYLHIILQNLFIFEIRKIRILEKLRYLCLCSADFYQLLWAWPMYIASKQYQYPRYCMHIDRYRIDLKITVSPIINEQLHDNTYSCSYSM